MTGYIRLCINTESHVTGYMRRCTNTESHVTGYMRRRTNTESHVTGYMRRRTNTESHVTGATLLRTNTESHVTGYIRRRTNTESHATGYTRLRMGTEALLPLMLLNETNQQREGRLAHIPVVEAIQFVERNVRMPQQFQQTPEVSGLLITTVQLFFAVAGNNQHRRTILPHVIERSRFVNQRLQRRHPHPVSRLKMGNHLPAEGNQSRNAVGILAIFRQQAPAR